MDFDHFFYAVLQGEVGDRLPEAALSQPRMVQNIID